MALGAHQLRGRRHAQQLGDPTKFRQGEFHIMMPGYFEVMRGRLIAGRTFGPQDDVPYAKTIIIDDRLAAMAFPNESPIGKHLLARISTPEPETFEVIGVIAHQRHTTLVGDEKESIYFSNGAQEGSGAGAWIVRTGGDPAKLEGPVRSALVQLDPQLLITDMKPLTAFLDRAMAPTRFRARAHHAVCHAGRHTRRDRPVRRAVEPRQAARPPCSLTSRCGRDDVARGHAARLAGGGMAKRLAGQRGIAARDHRERPQIAALCEWRSRC